MEIEIRRMFELLHSPTFAKNLRQMNVVFSWYVMVERLSKCSNLGGGVVAICEGLMLQRQLCHSI